MKSFPKWSVVGRLGAIAARSMRSGSKLVQEKELAASLGLSRSTLRHYRDAVDNVRALGDWTLRRRLLRGSAVAANVIARWLRRDPDAALDFIERNPTFTDAQVIAAARAIGRSGERRSLGERPLVELMREAAGWATEGLNEDISVEWRPRFDDLWFYEARCKVRAAEDIRSRFLGVEIELVLSSVRIPHERHGEIHAPPPGDELVVAVLPVPKYVVLERYRAEARSLWARLVALSVVYPLVVSVFPGPAARRHFASAIPEMMRASWTGQDRGRSRARRDCRSQVVLFKPSAHTGTIILSTRPGLAVDLFQKARRLDVRPGKIPRE